MNLLYVSNARMPTEKGHGWQIAKMCEAFSEAGAKVELFVPKRKNFLNSDPFSYYGVKKNFKINYLSCVDFIRYGKVWFYIQVLTFSFSALINSFFNKSYAIYSRDEVFSFLAGLFGKNIYYEMHDYPRSHKWFYRFVFKRVKKIVSTNQIKKEMLQKEFGIDGKKIVVYPNGIELDDFKNLYDKKNLRESLNLPIHKKIISHVGKYKTFGEEKGIKEIIHAFSKLEKQIPDLFMLIIGINEDEVPQVRGIFESFKVSSGSYKIIAHVLHKEVSLYMMSSDALVMNYPNTEHYAKFMSPLKMFEYMASGTPIVSSNLPSIAEILNSNNSVLVEPENSEKLCEGIVKVLKDESLAKIISTQALSDVKKYAWKSRAASLIKITQEI